MWVKKAAEGPAPIYTLQQQEQHNDRVRVLANIMKGGLGAGLLGLGVGGAYQLKQLAQRPDLNAGVVDPALSDHVLPYPVQQDPRKKKQQLKTAADKGMLHDFADKFWRWYSPPTPVPAPSTGGGGGGGAPPGGFSWKQISDTQARHPWSMPLGIAAVGGGAYAGWRGAQAVGNAYKKKEQDQDLEEAKKEYEAAMLGQHPAAQAPFKLAADKKALDLGSLYAAYAATSGGLSGLYAYNRYKKDKEDVLKAALRRRAAMRALESPPEVHLVPQPVAIDQPEKP